MASRRVGISALVIAFAASGWVFGQPSPTAGEYKAEEPANRGLDATLYMQSAAEYRASCYQAYNLATTRLEELFKANKASPTKAFAVVMDLDETVFDNSRFQAMLLRNGLAWDKGLWTAWEKDHSADVTLIPGAKEFIEKATALPVEVFYVSNRGWTTMQYETGLRATGSSFPIPPTAIGRRRWAAASVTLIVSCHQLPKFLCHRTRQQNAI